MHISKIKWIRTVLLYLSANHNWSLRSPLCHHRFPKKIRHGGGGMVTITHIWKSVFGNYSCLPIVKCWSRLFQRIIYFKLKFILKKHIYFIKFYNKKDDKSYLQYKNIILKIARAQCNCYKFLNENAYFIQISFKKDIGI